MLIKILLSGDGGQGIQLISDMLAQAAFANNFFVSQIPNYGLEQRGGVSLSYLQISDKEIAYSRFSEPDIMLVMSEQAKKRTEKFQISNFKFQIGDFGNELKEKNISIKSYNIFFLGLLAKLLEEKGVLKKEQVFALLEKKLSVKLGWEENKRAFEFGTLQTL